MRLSGDCAICNGKADVTFRRVEVWSNDRWRLTTTTYKAVKGFCYLDPKRHILYITELDGKEANEFGFILATVTKAIKDAGRSKLHRQREMQNCKSSLKAITSHSSKTEYE